jgi:hypothetical protein
MKVISKLFLKVKKNMRPTHSPTGKSVPVSFLKRETTINTGGDNNTVDELTNSISKLNMGTVDTKDSKQLLLQQQQQQQQQKQQRQQQQQQKQLHVSVDRKMHEVVGLDFDIIEKIVTTIREISNQTLSESSLNAEALLRWNESNYQAMIAGILATLRHSTFSKYIIKTVQIEPLITDAFQTVRSKKSVYGTKRLDVLIQLQNDVVLVFELKYIPLSYLAYVNLNSLSTSMTYDREHETKKQFVENNSQKSYKTKQKEIKQLEDSYLTFKVAPAIDERLEENGMAHDLDAVFQANEKNDLQAGYLDLLGHKGEQCTLRKFLENAKTQAMGYSKELAINHSNKRIRTYVVLGVWRKTMIFSCN